MNPVGGVSSNLDEAFARRLADAALDNVVREYPNKLDHLMASAVDVAGPRALHPVFYGSYDWHSSVHMHWTLVTLLAHVPTMPEADAIGALLDRHLAPSLVAGELAYLARPTAASFERPYGWAWLLKLSEALHRLAATDPRAHAWRDALQPLADAIVARTVAFLPRAVLPSRAGSHANSAFAALLMLDYATTTGATGLEAQLVAKAFAWFGADRAYPVAYETSSEDFLSNGLLEAVLIRRVLRVSDAGTADARFFRWWEGFVPDQAALAHWLTPLVPSDRGDARLTHVDGLNLTRAWCWRQLVDALPDALQTPIRLAIRTHCDESLPHAVAGDYVGTHWLASFALLALGF